MDLVQNAVFMVNRSIKVGAAVLFDYAVGTPPLEIVMTLPRLCSVSLLGALCVPSGALADDPFDALGAAGSYTMLGVADAYTGTASGFVQLGSAAHVYGDVGARSRIETAAGVIIEGDAHYGPGGSLHGGTVRGGNTQQAEADWDQIQDDAWAAVDAAFDLDATVLDGASASACSGSPTASGSVGSQTLVASRDEEGLSVYEFDGCLYLGDGETLTIEGTEEDRFVIRVTGGLRMDGGAAIVLEGLPGSAVLFVFDDGGWADAPWAQVTVWNGSTGGGAELSGVFLAPQMYWQLGDGTVLSDTRILAGGVQANIQDMYSTGTITGSPLEPEQEEEEEDDDSGDDGIGSIWGSIEICPPEGECIRITDGAPGVEGSESSSSAETSDEPDSSSESAHGVESEIGGKRSGSCSMAGLEAGALLTGLGMFAAGLRRRRSGQS